MATTAVGLRHSLLYVLAQLASPAAASADAAPGAPKRVRATEPEQMTMLTAALTARASHSTAASNASAENASAENASSSSDKSAALAGHLFDLAILEEAGQVSEPLALGVLLHAQRFVLVGDVRQLPPIVRSPLASYVHQTFHAVLFVFVLLFVMSISQCCIRTCTRMVLCSVIGNMGSA